MTVTITSPVLGKNVGETYTGPEEAWLLAQGYASQAGYTGAGVANTGVSDTTPANDPRLHNNREAPYFPLTEDRDVTMANDVDNLNASSHKPGHYDFDAAGTDTEAPSDVVLEPTEGKAAGGDRVTITGNNLENVTSVTFGGVAGTSLDASEANDGVIKVTSPAHAAGAVDVVLVDASGNTTKTAGFTYA